MKLWSKMNLLGVPAEAGRAIGTLPRKAGSNNPEASELPLTQNPNTFLDCTS